MSGLPVISSLWIGEKLSFLESLCLTSFADAGHRVKLYAYEDIKNVPNCVDIFDANTIMPSKDFIFHAASGAPGPHADKFRYSLLESTDEIWVDTDAYCVKPFPKTDYLFGSHFKSIIANDVLRLPSDSPTLHSLIEFCSDERPVLPENWWFQNRHEKAKYFAALNSNNRMHISEMRWETWGPQAITYFLEKNGEKNHQSPREVLYPLQGYEIQRALQKPFRAKIQIPDSSISIHFYGSKIRNLIKSRGGVPQPKSLLGQLCIKHNIDPSEAPID